MDVKAVMTTEVLSVAPEASLKEVALLLATRRISGVPVVEASGAVVGVVSEGDILYKQGGSASRGPLSWLLDPGGAAHRAKLEARTAADAMTSPAVTIQEWRSVAAAARLMLEERVNRLPVIRKNRLAGIVTRADLVRAFARSDDEIETEIREDVLHRSLMLRDPGRVQVAVTGGEVTLTGSVETRVEAEVAVEATARVPGVVGVHSTLAWR